MKIKGKALIIMEIIIIAALCLSYALFTYMRTGKSKTEIITGGLEFSYIEGKSATLSESFPVSDSIGAKDTRGEYTFEIGMKSSDSRNKMSYNVYLKDNNKGEKVFKNNQIKYAIVKNGVYVGGTTDEKGLKLSTIEGFNEEEINGFGKILDNQEISPGEVDRYILRIWISDDVKYTNEKDENGYMEGKYNEYTYSLKVKIDGQLTTTRYVNLNITELGLVTIDIEDHNGISKYAIKKENVMPTEEEWINVEGEIGKSQEGEVKKISNRKVVTSKRIKYDAEERGVYYIYVKNLLNMVSKKVITVSRLNVVVYLEANGGEVEERSKEIDTEGTYDNLPNATRRGYIFKGWYTKIDGGELANNKVNYEELKAKTLYAHWEKDKYTLTINPNEGTYNGTTGETTEQVTYMDTYELKKATRRGYKFKEWVVEGLGSGVENDTFTMGYEDTKITANWDIGNYKLKINPNGGKWKNIESNTEYNLNYMEKKEIEDPVREGYVFTGWEIIGGGTVINTKELTMGYEESTITASWAKLYSYLAEHYKQNVNLNGYTVVEADNERGSKLLGVHVTPGVKTYEGFTSPSAKEIIIGTNESENYVEYKYNRNPYKLYVNPNGGKYDNKTSTSEFTLYYEQEKTIENPVFVGYDFAGWIKTGGSLTDKKFKIGASDAIITATWEAQNYTVTLDVNGGSFNKSSIEVTYGEKYTDLPTTGTKNGYTFDGWYLGNTKITSNSTVTETSNHELTAKWNPVSYTISYNLNGGSISGNPTSYNIESNTFVIPVPTKQGYTFEGWNESQLIDTNLSHYIVLKGSEGIPTVTSKSLELEQNKYYMVAFDYYTLSGTNVFNVHLWPDDLPEIAPAATTSKQHISWSLSSGSANMKNSRLRVFDDHQEQNEADIIIENIGLYKAIVVQKGSTGNKSYTALWKPNMTTITAKANGGNILSTNGWSGTGTSSTKSVKVNDPYGTLPNVSRSGYTFKGWYDENKYSEYKMGSGMYQQFNATYGPYATLEAGNYVAKFSGLNLNNSSLTVDTMSVTSYKVLSKSSTEIWVALNIASRATAVEVRIWGDINLYTFNSLRIYKQLSSSDLMSIPPDHSIFAMWESN